MSTGSPLRSVLLLTAWRVRVSGQPSALQWPLLHKNGHQARGQQGDCDQAPDEDGQRDQR